MKYTHWKKKKKGMENSCRHKGWTAVGWGWGGGRRKLGEGSDERWFEAVEKRGWK